MKQITGGIVTYNNEKTIRACLTSIKEQTQNCPFQLYVYDNCSTDRTLDIIREEFPWVQLIEGKQNIGFGRGHNQIVKKVHSEYHVIINPDIILDQPVISMMAAYMEACEDVVQLAPQVRSLDGSVQYLPKRDPNFRYVILSKFPGFRFYRKHYTMENEKINQPSEVQSSSGCFFMVRTVAFKNIHGFDPRFFLYFEDADLSRRLRQVGKVVYHPHIYVLHEWKRDNTGSMKGICNFLKSMIKYYKKWR